MASYSKFEVADLSLGQLTDGELDEALAAFNGFSEIFGRAWIDNYFHGAQIPGFVRSIMAMWDDFQTANHLPRFETIVGRWRHGIDQLGVTAELRVFAQLCRAGLDLELFPPIPSRVPDARIRITPEQPWTYLEVSQRAISRLRNDAESVMLRISEKAADSRPGVHSKVAILRQPAEHELERILSWLASLPASGSRLGDLAILYLEPFETAVDTNDVLYYHVPQPCLFTTWLASSMPPKKATVCICIKDTGAEQMLKDEAKQLPPSQPSIIILDTSSVIGDIASWEPLIRRRFQPRINTRIGTVVLTRCYNAAAGRQAESKVLVNPYAKIPIDPEIVRRLERAFPQE